MDEYLSEKEFNNDMEHFENMEIENAAERPIEIITEEIQFYKQTAGAAILEIGKRLCEAKAMLNHGEWCDWLQNKVDFSEVTAQRFMRISKEYQNPSPVTDLGVSKALILLALPRFERDEFVAEKHVVNGEEKSVNEMSKRELEAAVREKNEALERENEANAKIAELNEQLEQEKKAGAETEKALEDAIAEVEALKNAPQEKAELSEDEINKIRNEAEAQNQNKLNALNKIIGNKARIAPAGAGTPVKNFPERGVFMFSIS